MTRMIWALALCGMAAAATPVAAQGVYEVPPAQVPAPPLEATPAPLPTPVPPAPHDVPLTRPSESLPLDNTPQNDAAAEAMPAENAQARFTFSRVSDELVRLDNRTGQVSVCSKRSVGWTCQLAPEDRGALENEIARLQEENASLKEEMLAHGVPGSTMGEPPPAPNEGTFSLPNDPNIDRMKVMIEEAWRRLVDMISALQKDVLKKS
jgi:hypothetical protein